jgi:hypothetical protein
MHSSTATNCAAAKTWKYAALYGVITNDCPIAVGVGDVVECAASLRT